MYITCFLHFSTSQLALQQFQSVQYVETSSNKLRKYSVSNIVLTFHCFSNILDFEPGILKSFSQSLEQFFLTERQDNFGNKISFFHFTFFRSIFQNFGYFKKLICKSNQASVNCHRQWHPVQFVLWPRF